MLNGLPIKALASDGEGWRHVSVSIQGSSLPPSWSVMCKVKDLFFEPNDWVIQFHPAHTEYVNLHPGVLHLWKPLNEALPIPNRLMVGPKDEEDLQKIEADTRIPLSQKQATRAIFEARNKA